MPACVSNWRLGGNGERRGRTSSPGVPQPVPFRERGWRDWYNTAAWLRRRSLQLKFEPLCKICLDRDKTTPATIVDHVEPHQGDWNKFRLGALQSLCKRCHDQCKQRIDRRGYSFDVGNDGWPTDPRHPANKQR